MARKGEEVRVKGKVARVLTTSSGSITFINFEGIEMGGFSGVVHREEVAEIGRALGSALCDVLTGKEIVLKGRVTLYEGKPQIEVRSASQIEVEGKVTAPPASDLPSITNTPALRALEGKGGREGRDKPFAVRRNLPPTNQPQTALRGDQPRRG